MLLFCDAASSVAQSSDALNNSSALSQTSVYQWTGENGLISNNITSAIQSSEGFMWITTYNGIMRFDGQRIIVYDRGVLPFLATDAFYQVYEDKKGVLWFASQGSGIVLYQDKKFKLLEVSGEKMPKSVRSILIEDDGSVWIGSNNEGLFKMTKGGELKRLDHAVLNTLTIFDITKDKKGKVWIATDGDGLFSFNGTHLEHFDQLDGLLSNNVNTLALSKGDTLYVGTADGLQTICNGKLRTVNFLKNIPINDIYIDKENRKWFATENGLARISGNNVAEELTSRKKGFAYTRLNSISRDREGSIWISSGRDGLLQMRETGIMNVSEEQGLSNNRINIVVEEANKTLYIGSDAGTVDRYTNGEITSIVFKTDLKEAAIRDICEGANGTLWIASYRGILRMQGKSEKLLGEKDGLTAIDMRRVLRDKNSDLWFASRSGGLFKFSQKLNRVIKHYNKDQGLESNYILSLEENSKGDIYVGTHSGGLTIIKNDGSTNTYHISKDDAGVLIFNIHLDKDGNVWVVSNLGLYRFNNGVFKKIRLQAINKGETYFDWLEDNDHNAWITTNLGVLKIEHTDLQNFFAGRDSVVHTKLYDNHDGMKNKECTGATRSLVSSNGDLWIPTLGGIAVFSPDKIVSNALPPPVYVTDLITDSETFVSDTVIVEPGNLRYIFNYTALSYTAPTKIKFKYRLEPINKTWVESEMKRDVEYTNLSPGTYTFRVMASNNDDIWNTTGDSKVLIVKPFFYQTVWFYIICFLAVVILLYTIYQWRIYVVEKRNRELRKLNSELDRFVYSASHDLRAPLASILGLIAVARLDKSNNVEEYLNLIEKSIHKLDGFIRDIIDFSRNSRLELDTEPIKFESMIHEIIDELKYMDERGLIRKIVEVNGSGDFCTDRKRLAIILRNLISNAYKYHNPYTEDNFVHVTVKYSGQEATIKVADSGIGISEEHLSNIFKMFYRANENNNGSGLGLYIVKETVEKLKGSITVHSEPNQGSTFELKLVSIKPAS
ncbi:GHKL domain-containing protein [Chryseotalea sanaruensis]|uniref:histidine kinase n=1 Tax=Chryseotalea sanaruensis TaxID=2482724 RepID=A0A401U8Q9_9BACT|nr:GHKL domain-containing protein [Chryseotalea sanaruensis]